MASVLIIDAEEEFAGRIADLLRTHGADPTLTGDGKAGLDAARINIPDAIILCVELPRMSGYSICAKLKKDSSLRSVPLVITSSEATQETFEHHKKLKTRAEEYLKKPFDPPVLVDVLRGYIPLAPGAGSVTVEGNGQDIEIDEQPPMTLSDAEAFSEDEREKMSVGAIDEELDRLATNPPPLPSTVRLGLGETMGLPPDVPEGMAEDEVMTAVGTMPLVTQLQDAQRREAELQAALEEAQRARDEALASERAALAQTSQIPQGASPGREALALKRELSARDHQILELKDQLHQKEKLLLGQKDHEVELEGRIVQAQEERDEAERRRSESEARSVAELERVNEERKKLEGRISELEGLLSQSNAQAAELDSVLQSKEEETTELNVKLREHSAEIDSLSGQNRALGSEITRLTNELSAAAAESDTLREQLQSAQRQAEELVREQANLEERLDNTKDRLAETQKTLSGTEVRLSDALAMLETEEERKSKAKQAIDIASALLAESLRAEDEPPNETEAMPEMEEVAG